MTIREVGGASSMVAWTDPTVAAMARAQESVDEQRRASREAQRSAEETQARAAAAEVAAMHAAAEKRMLAGILEGVGTIGAAVGDGIGAGVEIAGSTQGGEGIPAAGLGSGDGSSSEVSSVAAQTSGNGTGDAAAAGGRVDAAAAYTAVGFRAGGKAFQGSMQIVGSVFEGEAAHADAMARAHRQTAEDANRRADEMRDDGSQAARSADRAMEVIGQYIQARRQAEQAATRA